MSESVALTPQIVAVLFILAFAVFLFASEIVRVDTAAIIVMVILGLGGIVPGERIFDGFASNAVIAIIAIMIMGEGLDKCGVMGRLANRIIKVGGSKEKRVIPIISGTVSLVSGFMQNVGAAALFLPVMSRIATRTGIPLSRLLMPMAFCAILGGTLTMVGSSPLILLNDLILGINRSLPDGVEYMDTFGLFAVTPVGIVLVIVGILYLSLARNRVLPTRGKASPDPGVTSRYLEDAYGIKGSIFEAEVSLESPLAGMTVRATEIMPRAPYIVGIRDSNKLRLEPPGGDVIPVGSTLALLGSQEYVKEFTRQFKLRLKPNLSAFLEALNPSRSGVSEVVLPPGSNVLGKTIIDIQLRRNHGASLLALYRDQETIRTDLRSQELRAGDTLVVHSSWADLYSLSQDRNFVVVTDFPRYDAARADKATYALCCFTLALGLIVLTELRLPVALLAGAVGMMLCRVLTVDEAYRAISWQTVFLLAGLIPLGMAVDTSGTATWIAAEILLLFGDLPHWMLQTAIAILATFFTLLVSNVGATVLLVPLAVNIAIGAGANPAVFALTVALATSNSFFIPTHQVNALVLGPAGYRVADFIRAGGIMTVLYLVTMISMLNLVY